MSVKCQVILEAMEKIAPRRLAESWDNVGLLVGSPAAEISRLLICLDVSSQLIERAAADGVDMIIAHHPLIFKPLKAVRTDLPLGRELSLLLKNDIAVYAAHTNLDIAGGGVNDVLAAKLGLQHTGVLAADNHEELCKLTVFVPADYLDSVRTAIGEAGAGHIGKYSHCTFAAAGTGQFLPQAGAEPFIGSVGKIESTAEYRLETIVPAVLLRRVLRAMLKAHPYEEVAYDVYPLKNEALAYGLGRIGELAESVSLEAFCCMVKTALNQPLVRLIRANDRRIRKIALCSGSGADFIGRAVFAGADVFVTGDMKYHDAQRAVQQGLNIIDAGHFGTEFPVVTHLAQRLRALAASERWRVEIAADQDSSDFFQIV